VYGLGSTLVYLFTGRPPAPGVPARIAGVPTALAELTGRLLAEQPEDRPASAAAVARALRRFNAGHDLPALAAGSAARPRRRLAGRAAAAAGLLLAAAGAAALLRHDPPSADDQAAPVAAAAPAPVVASPPPAPTLPLGELGLTEEVSRRLRQTWAVYLGRSVVEHNTLGMELCFVPPGRLLLQSSYLATVSRPYYLGACEVTVGQFRAFVMATGYVTWAESSGRGGELLTFFPRGKDLRPEYTWRAPGFPIGDDHPVVQVSWHDAEAFCRWLSRREGKTYRLPTAAEWKWAGYAARPRGEANRVLRATAVYCRDEDHPFTVPQPVGGRPPNPWGLRDMLGNVMEWGADWHGPTPQGPFTDPCGPAEGTKKLLLGGHYGFALRPLLVNNTMISDPDAASSYVGFRVLREP
jgi:hypothetical protein